MTERYTTIMATHAELIALRKSAARNTKLSTSRNPKRKGNQGTPGYSDNRPKMTDAKLSRYIRGLSPDISAYALRLAIKRVNREFDSTGTANIRLIVSTIQNGA